MDSATVAQLVNTHADAADPTWQRSTYEHLHAHPELSAVEEKTAEFLVAELRQMPEFAIHTGIGGHGVVAVLENGPGPVVVFRADIDGLPVTEATGVPFASVEQAVSRGGSTSGVMHACGHDMHMTAALSAARIVHASRENWSGTFVALFQPAEETASGADQMLTGGLTEVLPHPDVYLGQHVVPGPAGQVMSMPGPALAGCDTVSITIKGRSAHGSMPHNSIDPTYAAAAIVLRLQGIVGREIPPHDFGVVSVGTLQSGNSNNTIPGEARIVLNIRFYSTEVRRTLINAIERVVEGECRASGITEPAVIEYSDHGEVTDNDSDVYGRVRETFDALFDADTVTATAWTASEDFSNIPRALDVPYHYWTVGVTPRQRWEAAVAADRVIEDIPSNHMATFIPDFEPTMAATTKAAAGAILTELHAR